MLQIRLLGQFDIRMEGKRVMIPSRAGQSLLSYLALTAGTAHRREKLAGTLWPDTIEENARKNLRQELWRIRKAISTLQTTDENYLIADEFTLKFNRDAKYWLDVNQLERPDLDLQSLITNLSLYQGELLPGFYDEWISLERERVQGVFDSRMEQLLEQLITAERWVAVQEWGERWLTISGVHEQAYRALMQASAAHGDMAKVASIYQHCKDELIENLGIEPAAETRAIYDELLIGTNTSIRKPSAHLVQSHFFLLILKDQPVCSIRWVNNTLLLLPTITKSCAWRFRNGMGVKWIPRATHSSSPLPAPRMPSNSLLKRSVRLTLMPGLKAKICA
jgi:DNA-binding SARP family transcriptional activator